MEVTEVKVKLVRENRDRLKAYCTMTLDGEFVVRDLKLIEGTNGLFVAMPSRKLADRCPSCGGKNHLRARFCTNCGAQLDETRVGTDRDGRLKLHADIAHPINASCRERIQKAIEKAYAEEVERSKLPGYRPVDLDEPEDDSYHHSPHGGSQSRPETGSGPSEPAADKESGQTFGQGVL
jgi:stage V sporulation protein G